ncbi:myo-inositol-1(or 4)-monophosphatase [Methanohalophilus levihalophilus]|uniref:bifunctional fructose-bisphosphatase/inositol-phosphate phosphatase n=1 Tax=Methanohalophilus levihalophilus TaxID=1431282 RepID=UPI001AE58AE3|nr:bifunctional fructose-bisphosphatase/inositol-phosphate phosphatase [Methanohalophilus levihalophilus]MBP2029804.1 myo-inositol-1(or 4)-monophosphatase [Methanohalophilus levihalophilus]
MENTNEFLDICERASEKTIEAISKLVGTQEAYKEIYVGADGTPTRLIDEFAEKAILEVFESTGIPMRVLSEEIGEVIFGNNPEITIALDPLDGTYNSSMGIPFYSISIAIGNLDLSRVDFGYVRNLANNDTYYAIAGKGAYFNGERIHISGKKELKEACASLYGYRKNVEHTLGIAREIRRVRLLGSVALELCYVASGKMDAIVDVRNSLRLVDVAAGKLILEEAGGTVTNGAGRQLSLDCNVINRLSMVASNGYVHKAILECIGGKYQ